MHLRALGETELTGVWVDLRTQVAAMKLNKLLVIVAVLLSSVYFQDSDGWSGLLEQGQWPNSAVIQDLLVRITRKPASARKHLGLRRKDSRKLQTVPKRHNFQTFVGLMGKRNVEQQGEA